MYNYLLIIVIGIIMPQLNISPVNVSKNIELKDESASFYSTTSKDNFSKYVDLHLNKNKEDKNNSNVASVKVEVNIAKKSNSLTESELGIKQPNDLVNNSDKNYKIDSGTLLQKVAAPGNEDQIKSNEIDQKALLDSEQLMSFLTKADNTLINQSVDTSSISPAEQGLEWQKTVEQKAQYEAQLLLKSSNLVADLSAVAKALGKDQVGVTSPEVTSKQLDSAEELFLSHAAIKGKKSTSVKLPVDSLIEEKTKNNTSAEVTAALVKSTENKPMLSELSESNTESKTTDFSSVNASKDNSDNARMSNEKTNQNTLQKEVTQSSKAEVLSHSQLVENEKVNTNLASQSTNNQAQSDAVKSLENTVDGIEKQVNTSKQIQSDNKSSVPDAQLTKSQISQSSESAQSSEVIKPNEKANQAAAQLNKTALPSNQSTTSDLIHDDVSKTQAKQSEKAQLSAEQNQQKLVAQPEAQNEDGVFVEDKAITNTKIAPSANRHLTDVSGNVTQTPQHITEQQSAEMLNPSLATDVTQNQKTNAQLHQETISLFRKDFTEAVKDKVMLMISQKLQRFDITLDPPELGNMQVRVNLQGEQAVVSFIVQSQQTKDALEQNMHKLRESLAEQGINVGDANVEQQSQQSANEEGSLAGNNSQMEGEIDNMAEANDVVAHTLSAQMLDSSTASVDYYA
jgi:flagellar hook-length control protein FliK